MELTVRGERIEGTSLGWSEKSFDLLARDGSWLTLGLDEPEAFRKTADGFRPYSQGEVRALLLGEFGRGFEVTGTGNYLVVHPAGKRNQWADRFEELYRSFVQYFAVRGLRLESPRFPLVAVAFPTRNEFVAYAARQGVHVPDGMLGYYSRRTNRVLLYDLAADGVSFDVDNAGMVVHEATHQTAFNTGVHNRFAAAPVWMVEGLATMFEAPGVYVSRRNVSVESRINRGRLEAFRRYAAEGKVRETLAEIVASDRLFPTQPDIAYAHAWALTFYLSEQQPQQYARYLAKTAARPALAGYSGAERTQDFAEHFGADFAMLEARLLRFIATLK